MTKPMMIIDAHQDLAWNILSFGRDYTLSADEIRRREAGTGVPTWNGDSVLGWPEYQRGRVALIFSTLFAAPVRRKEGPWDTQVYLDAAHANRLYRSQLEVYYRLVDDHPEKFKLVRTQADLEAVIAGWEQDGAAEFSPAAPKEEEGAESGEDVVTGQAGPAAGRTVGLVLLMEGAEAVRYPAELEEWWEAGVRLIGPAWAGNRFCGGTREPGPLTSEGFALLEGMAGLGFTLDLSHMDEPAALQALDSYPGPVVATHSNALRLLKGSDSNRHLTDPVIHRLLERDGVIGVVPLNSFLIAGWKRGDRRDEVSLQQLVAQIDYICQLAGDARHVGLGSDFDGGYGLQSLPVEIDTIADLQKLAPLLAEKGYEPSHIADILGGNWLRHLRQTLP